MSYIKNLYYETSLKYISPNNVKNIKFQNVIDFAFFKKTNFFILNEALQKYTSFFYSYYNTFATLKYTSDSKFLLAFNKNYMHSLILLSSYFRFFRNSFASQMIFTNFQFLFFFKRLWHHNFYHINKLQSFNLFNLNNYFIFFYDTNLYLNINTKLYATHFNNNLNITYLNKLLKNFFFNNIFKNTFVRFNYELINADIQSIKRLRVTRGIVLPSDTYIHIICVSRDVIHS
jgi:hypothetical protein